MSAWSQAIWIVQELQKNFNFSDLIDKENVKIDAIQEQLNNDKEYIEHGTVTLLAKKRTNTTPDTELTTFANGTIWFVQQDNDD